MDNSVINQIQAEDERPSQENKTKNYNLQDIFLNYARKEKIVLTIYLMNGFQLRGIVRGFDSYAILFESDEKTSLVYKHAISTIMPSRPINVFS